MGVDFYPCGVCNEVFNDCGYYTHCAGCDGFVGPCCMGEMADKYGHVEDQEAIDEYGDNAVTRCDNCVDKEDKNSVLSEAISLLGDWMVEYSKHVESECVKNDGCDDDKCVQYYCRTKRCMKELEKLKG